jgi:hypothetical protein
MFGVGSEIVPLHLSRIPIVRSVVLLLIPNLAFINFNNFTLLRMVLRRRMYDRPINFARCCVTKLYFCIFLSLCP